MKFVLCFSIDSSMYAHFLFEAFDTNKNGSVSFEVSIVQSLLSVVLKSGSAVPMLYRLWVV